MNSQPPSYSPVSQLGRPQPRKSRGCFFYGCLFTVISGLLGSVLIGVMFYFGFRQLAQQILTVAENQPRQMPQAEATPEQIKALKDRLEAFSQNLESDELPTEVFELTELEMNQLIQGEDDFRGRLYVDFEPGRIRCEISIPLDLFSSYFGDFSGKYLNGAGEISAEITPMGLLDVHLLDLTGGNGQKLPDDVLKQLQRENLAGEFNNKPESRKILGKLDRLEILKDRVRLVPRKKVVEADTEKPEIPNTQDFDRAVDEFRDEAAKP